MRLSVSAWCLQEQLFSGEITIYDVIKLCYKNGIASIELLDCFVRKEDIEEINRLLKKLDMRVSSYSVSNDFALVDSQERKEQLQYIKKSMDTALALGTGIMRVFSGSLKDGVSLETAEDWIVECYREIVPFAKEKGIIMVLENHGLLAGKSDQVKRILDRVGSTALKANADIGNFLLANENSLEAVNNLGSRIGFVHLKDLKKAEEAEDYPTIDGSMYQGVVLGKGDVPVNDIIQYLKEKHYSGYLSIEYEGPGDPVRGTVECIRYMRGLLA
jgi:sugar phosphate isomerase/epimerase